MSKRIMTSGGLLKNFLLVTLAAGVVSVFGGAVPDLDHARVSYDAGKGMVKGKNDADWSYVSVNTLVLPGDNLWVDEQGTMELEMSGGSYLRLADGSKAEVVSVTPRGLFRAWTGVFYLQRSPHSIGEMVVETPTCQVLVEDDAQVRFDVIGNGATTVTVRWGKAVVSVQGGQPVPLRAGERSFVDPGYLPSEPKMFDRSEEDAFDLWNRERTRLLAVGRDSVPRELRLEQAPVGISDLSPYGEWVRVDSDYCWRPTAVSDFVPYRNGHWSYVAGCGQVWVDDYPFCYVTSHYGRWRHHDRYGWVWSYRDGWSPAWVATVHYGDNFVWCPLDPFDRPVSFGADFYTVGGLRFGLAVSTSCLAAELLAGPCRVRPCTPLMMRNVPADRIGIWNIYARDARPEYLAMRGRGVIPYAEHGLKVHDFEPHRVMRGWETTSFAKEPARLRATTLETKDGRHDFAVFKGSPPQHRDIRTGSTPSALMAKPRSVNLNPTAFQDTRDRTSRSIMTIPTQPGRSPDHSKQMIGREGVAPRYPVDLGGGMGKAGRFQPGGRGDASDTSGRVPLTVGKPSGSPGTVGSGSPIIGRNPDASIMPVPSGGQGSLDSALKARKFREGGPDSKSPGSGEAGQRSPSAPLNSAGPTNSPLGIGTTGTPKPSVTMPEGFSGGRRTLNPEPPTTPQPQRTTPQIEKPSIPTIDRSEGFRGKGRKSDQPSFTPQPSTTLQPQRTTPQIERPSIPTIDRSEGFRGKSRRGDPSSSFTPQPTPQINITPTPQVTRMRDSTPDFRSSRNVERSSTPTFNPPASSGGGNRGGGAPEIRRSEVPTPQMRTTPTPYQGRAPGKTESQGGGDRKKGKDKKD